MFDDDMFQVPKQSKKEEELMKLIINEIGKASEYIYLNTNYLYKISQFINGVSPFEEFDGMDTSVYYYDVNDESDESIEQFLENLKKEIKRKKDGLDE